MARARRKPKKGKAREPAIEATRNDEQPLVAPYPPNGSKSTIKSVFRGFLNFYLIVGIIYFFWTLTFLQFRECGLFRASSDTSCYGRYEYMSNEVVLSLMTAIVPKLALYSVSIAFFRALLWLPNLMIETLRGSFLTWLFLRDVPPMHEFFLIWAQILP